MNKQDIFERIKEILVEEFEVDAESITPDSNLYSELELDSLDSVDLIVALENEFDFKIDRAKDEGELRELRTVTDVSDFIQTKINA
jgi:acyl carrier protein